LQEVLVNLFENAVKHGSADDHPPAHDTDWSPVAVEIGRITASDRTGFYLEDDGAGIPDDQRETVFEWGHTSSADGTGFGLAIVAEIVQAHSWEITAMEADSGGARFEVTGI